MSQKKAKAQRRAAKTVHLSNDNSKPWTPLGRAIVTNNPLYDVHLDGECFKNERYTVFRRMIAPGFIHLSIRRDDREAGIDWRDFQRIKSELAGPEWEGVELYPAESRVVDTSNQYHLWCFDEKVPFGFDNGRCVTDEFQIAGAKQRPLPDDWEKTMATDLIAQAKEIAQIRKEGKELGIDFREEACR
jgi:hypothetical protein